MSYCLYLHGFLSSGESYKGRWFTEKNLSTTNSPLGKIICPTYSQKDLLAGIAPIEALLQRWQETGHQVLLMGSSLGGYLAQYYGNRFNLPYIMINPALNPCDLFEDYLGEHTNPYTGETLVLRAEYQSVLAKLEVAAPNPEIHSLLLADSADEIADIPFAVNKYQNLLHAQTIIYPGGNHAFIHLEEAWPEIVAFAKSLKRQAD